MNIYHICNRGFEKNQIFFDDSYYVRFVENMYRFNNLRGALRLPEARGITIFDKPPPQKKIVDVLKWSLLPNHYHILVRECVEGGAVEFAKRIGNGFTKYVNIRNERSGYLFQNAAKIVPVETDRHFLYLPFYIDLNPLDLISPKWHKQDSTNVERTRSFLLSYKWSSFRDYVNTESEFDPVVSKGIFYDAWETDKDTYLSEITEWLVSADKKSTSRSLRLSEQFDPWQTL